jgi:hypothetical protein
LDSRKLKIRGPCFFRFTVISPHFTLDYQDKTK